MKARVKETGAVEVKLEGDEIIVWIKKGSESINVVFHGDVIRVVGWTEKPITKKTYRIDK